MFLRLFFWSKCRLSSLETFRRSLCPRWTCRSWRRRSRRGRPPTSGGSSTSRTQGENSFEDKMICLEKTKTIEETRDTTTSEGSSTSRTQGEFTWTISLGSRWKGKDNQRQQYQKENRLGENQVITDHTRDTFTICKKEVNWVWITSRGNTQTKTVKRQNVNKIWALQCMKGSN